MAAGSGSAKIMPGNLMHASLIYILTATLALALTAASLAHAQPAAGAAPAPREAIGPVRTGKERLGNKWSDEQRLDNCKVPPDKRGSKPRRDACPEPLTH